MIRDVNDWLREQVAGAPPLAQWQRDCLGLLFQPHTPRPAPVPDPVAVEAEQARQRGLAEAREAARAVLACDVCSAPPEAHHAGVHPWEPGRLSVLAAETVRRTV